MKQENVAKLLRQIEQLQEKVYKDSLTGVYNRRIFDEQLFLSSDNGELPESISFIMADVTHFKLLNDCYGHLTGDCCLKEVAHALNEGVTPGDYVLRYGGDEFLIILKNRSTAEISALIPILQEKVSKIRIPSCPSLTLQINMGYAHTDFPRQEPDLFLHMLEVADRQMYKEKQTTLP